MQLNSLLETLNLSNKDGLFFYDDLLDKSTDFLSIRIKESLYEYLKPDAFFCINNEPLILFFSNPDNLDVLQKQIWNFNQSPTIFINQNNNWIIKNGFKYVKNENELETLSNNISDFDYFKIITGETWEDYKQNFENKNRVDYFLLQNIGSARNILIEKCS